MNKNNGIGFGIVGTGAMAGDRFEVHPLIDRPVPFRPQKFDIPPEATATGELTLKWHAEEGFGGNSHG